MAILINIPEIFGVSIEVYFIILLLAGGSFFFWNWILKKFIKEKRTRKIATWLTTIIAAPILYIIIFWVIICYISYYPSKDFNQQQWMINKEKRYELSQNIIDSKILIGKSKGEIRQMLGDEGNPENSNYWGYDLGVRPQLLGIDPDILNIEFKNDKVIAVSQHS